MSRSSKGYYSSSSSSDSLGKSIAADYMRRSKNALSSGFGETNLAIFDENGLVEPLEHTDKLHPVGRHEIHPTGAPSSSDFNSAVRSQGHRRIQASPMRREPKIHLQDSKRMSSSAPVVAVRQSVSSFLAGQIGITARGQSEEDTNGSVTSFSHHDKSGSGTQQIIHHDIESARRGDPSEPVHTGIPLPREGPSGNGMRPDLGHQQSVRESTTPAYPDALACDRDVQAFYATLQQLAETRVIAFKRRLMDTRVCGLHTEATCALDGSSRTVLTLPPPPP